MVELKVTQIDLAVHQDYHNMLDTPPVADERQRALRERWATRAQELAKIPDGVMIVFPASRATELYSRNNPIIRDERDRIRELRSLLGDRLYVPNKVDLSIDEYRCLFRSRKWTIDGSTNLWVYGEYYGSCVIGWGEIAKKALGISDSNYRRVIELSRGADDNCYDKKVKEGKVVFAKPLWTLN